LYFRPPFFIKRWTSAICFETEAVGVPIGMRQKSAVHFGGVARSMMSDDIVDWINGLMLLGPVVILIVPLV
jgi:hypothetical protein